MVTKSRLEGIEFKYQADEDTFRALQDSYESNLAKYGEDYALTISSGEKFALQLLLRIRNKTAYHSFRQNYLTNLIIRLKYRYFRQNYSTLVSEYMVLIIDKP